jgi:hypothetical protein
MAAVVEKFLLGSVTSLLTTGLNSLANNSLAISSAFDNTIGQTGDGYTLCDLELVVTFGTNPTANTGVSIWFLQTQDGTNYEDGGTSTTPARAPDVVFPVAVSTSAQRLIARALLPWGLMKVLLKNDGTGQAFAASGNTLKIRPVTREAV